MTPEKSLRAAQLFRELADLFEAEVSSAEPKIQKRQRGPVKPTEPVPEIYRQRARRAAVQNGIYVPPADSKGGR